MINNKTLYILPLEAVFYTLNRRRKMNGLTEIEHTQIASKLGILFTLKNKVYINFKSEHVELDESQILLLDQIIGNYFNVEIMDEILSLAIKRPLQTEIGNHSVPHTQPEKGLFAQIKGFLKVQATPA